MNLDIEPLYQSLYAYIRNRISNVTDAEDVTQDVFLKLSASDLSQVNNVKSWMYAIARNSITDYYRKKKLVTQTSENLLDESSENDQAAIKELGSCVHSFIKQLPEDYQRIMIMSEINNIPQKEIAETLEMNYITVRSKVQRGRSKLKELFTNCCHIEVDKRGAIIDYHEKSNRK